MLVQFFYGTQSTFDSTATKDENALYFLTDSHKIYKGNILMSDANAVSITETTDSSGDVLATITINGNDYSFYTTTSVMSKITAAITAHNTLATGTNSGHVTLSDSTTSTSSTNDGVAATPKAVSDALQEAKNYTDSHTVTDALVFRGSVSSAADVAALTNVTNGSTWRSSGNFTLPDNQEVEEGDLLVAHVYESGGSTVTEWFVFQTNIDGAVTSSTTLTSGSIILGDGNKTVKSLSNGVVNTILQMTANGPAWVTPEAAGITDNTTYTFVDGTTGNFTVTPSTTGATPQTVSIGKPATAGTADQVAHSLTIGNQTYNGSVNVSVGTTNTVTEDSTDLVTSGAVYNALVWQSLGSN